MLSEPKDVDARLVENMIRMIDHRGPDGIGIHSDAMAGLGHARLSIIDLEGGRQPMTNEDGTLWIVFNGEIFNYIELASDLARRGHIFSTQSDTEVILHLFEEYGEDCVRHLNGQWAFAIWNSRKRELFLSRDRNGIRPLFYTFAGSTFVFGSEIKALFAHPGVRREVDPQALDDIFTLWCVMPPRTVFRGVSELPPGHSMYVRNGAAKVFRHWAIDFSTPQNERRSEADYAAELFDLLVDATRLRLRADVPVGAFLSGGLDSTITTALIRRFTDAKLRTFSVTFEDREYDEQEYQRQAVEFFGTDHSAIRCSDADIGEVFPDVVWHTEAPLVRTAPAPMFLLSRLVRESNFKVVLTGEGSDEMLGGYDIFKEAKIRRFWQAQPDSKLRPLLLRRLYDYMPNLRAQPDSYVRAFFQIDGKAAPGPFFSHMPRWQLTARNKVFFSGDVKAELSRRDIYSDIAAELPQGYAKWDAFSQAQYLEARYLLPGYILSSQGDRVAMAHGVEGRYPFLDHRVVDFAAKVPSHLKMKVLNEKYLLKQAFGKLLPLSIAKRSKQPYRAPEARCLFTSPVRDYIEEMLSPEQIRRDNLFDPAVVGRMVKKAKSNQVIGVKDNMALVAIASTQILVNQFVNGFQRRRNERRTAAA